MVGHELGTEHGKRGALRGRRSECAALDDMIAALRTGQSRVLVVRGSPGVGKSALLDHAERSALDDVHVLRSAGVESETELAFAALHQLCAPLLERLQHLPAPQSAALETAFGMTAGPWPDPFLVGLAVLGLLSDASQERPLLCLVDDAQWLDAASAQVLGFVGRRLLAESIVLVFGARALGRQLIGLPELEVTGLAAVDAHALLESVTLSRLDRHVRDRVVAETRGNPQALLELTRGLSVTQVAGGFGLLNGGSPAGTFELDFLTRVGELPPTTRLLLLVAAAEPVGDPVLVWRAAERLGLTPAAALDDGTDGLLTVDDRVTFPHPQVRSAVYRAAEAADRRAVHLALAEVTDEQLDPDRRAWHLASAAAGPDEAVAAELERSAGRAQVRGGLGAAAAFLQRALALTQDTDRRVDRALVAAGASLQAGDFGAARRYLDAAHRDARDEGQLARIQRMRGQVALASGTDGDACALLFAAARRLEPLDPALARETYLAAWGAAARAADEIALDTVGRAIGALPEASDTRPVDVLLEGYALLGRGSPAAAVPVLQRAAGLLAHITAEDILGWGWVATGVGPSIWDEEVMRAMYTRQVEVAQEAGALTDLSLYLNASGLVAVWSGDFPAAAEIATEAQLVATSTGVTFAASAALRLAALRGREAEVSTMVTATAERARAGGQGMALALAYWSAAELYNGLARYEEALASARKSTRIGAPWVSTWALSEIIEAGYRSGDTDLAHAALERLTDATAACDTDWALGTATRCRALLSDGAEAERLYIEAIDRLGRTRLRPELARAYLLHGEWLRRQGQRGEARAQLRSAHDLFTAIGMDAFAERTRRELLATGETVRKRTIETASSNELTPQQRQIALLVRDGLSNPEVGSRLFLSPRTVEWHLRKIFLKLSITSRRQLRDALPRIEDDLMSD